MWIIVDGMKKFVQVIIITATKWPLSLKRNNNSFVAFGNLTLRHIELFFTGGRSHNFTLFKLFKQTTEKKITL